MDSFDEDNLSYRMRPCLGAGMGEAISSKPSSFCYQNSKADLGTCLCSCQPLPRAHLSLVL